MSSVVPTTLTSRQPILSAAPKRGFVTMVAKGIVAHVRQWRDRRSAASLMHLDARLLADIGLTRADVAVTLRSPVGDPCAELQRLAEERRDRARSAARDRLAEALGVAAE